MECIRCGICSENYEIGSHVPLVLPCGHTFCSECIHNLVLAGAIECPVCRKSHDIIDVGNLPKNFALLSLTDYNRPPVACKTHGDPLRFWCSDCKEEVCGLCMFDEHPRDLAQGGHRITPIASMVAEKKANLSKEANWLLHAMSFEMNAHERSYLRYEKKLIKLLKMNKEFCHLHKQVETAMSGLMEMQSVRDVLEGENQLRTLQAQCEKVFTSSSLTNSSRKYADERDTESVQKISEYNAYKETSRTVSLNLRCLNGGTGQLQWDRGRLLLFALPGQTLHATHNGIQMIAVTSGHDGTEETEAFLELSSGDLVLGRVFIRLYKHLRRAQHFLSLCLGTFGPSFKSSRLVAVKRRNEPEESVAGGDYLTPEGVFTARALMTDLEWGGIYAGERREGLVVGSSGGYVEEDARFGISTSTLPSGQCQCPFGEVTEGLDVVRKTLTFNQVSEVQITECGVVVHHFNF